jgi:hypothetical protein
MKKLPIPSLVVLLLTMSACGGGDAVENPLNPAGLTEEEIAAVAGQLEAAATDATRSATESPSSLAAPRSLTRTTPLGGQQPCPLGGRITRSGNVTVTATEDGAWSVYGLVTFLISDPTNNLNDCEVARDVILDGTLTLAVAGTSEKGGVGASLTGTIGINRRGPTGGLIPRGDCNVFINVPVGATQATGSVCGQSIR